MNYNKISRFLREAQTKAVLFWLWLVILTSDVSNRINRFLRKVKKITVRLWQWLVKVAPGITVVLKFVTAIINLITALKPYWPKIIRWGSWLLFMLFPESSEPMQ